MGFIGWGEFELFCAWSQAVTLFFFYVGWYQSLSYDARQLGDCSHLHLRGGCSLVLCRHCKSSGQARHCRWIQILRLAERNSFPVLRVRIAWCLNNFGCFIVKMTFQEKSSRLRTSDCHTSRQRKPHAITAQRGKWRLQLKTTLSSDGNSHRSTYRRHLNRPNQIKSN